MDSANIYSFSTNFQLPDIRIPPGADPKQLHSGALLSYLNGKGDCNRASSLPYQPVSFAPATNLTLLLSSRRRPGRDPSLAHPKPAPCVVRDIRVGWSNNQSGGRAGQ